MERSDKFSKGGGSDKDQSGWQIDGRKAKVAAAIGFLLGCGIVAYKVNASGNDEGGVREEFKAPELLVETDDPELNNYLRCLWVKFNDVMGCDEVADEEWVEANCDEEALGAFEDATAVKDGRKAAMEKAALPDVESWTGHPRSEYSTCSRELKPWAMSGSTPEQRGRLMFRQRR